MGAFVSVKMSRVSIMHKNNRNQHVLNLSWSLGSQIQNGRVVFGNENLSLIAPRVIEGIGDMTNM